MRNERLRQAMGGAGLGPVELAEYAQVDPKTVERWVSIGRVPHRGHRRAVARRLQVGEATLWPTASTDDWASRTAGGEVVEVYAHRSAIAGDLWRAFLDGATARLDVLAFAGLFLPEQTYGLPELLAKRASDGVSIRILLADPDSKAVQVRGTEEGIGDAVAIKSRNAAQLYRPLADTTGVEVRLHATTLYTSIYRVDDEMIANPHILGLPGAQAPALHLRRLAAGGLFDTYAAMYERVWEQARPAWT